MPQSKLDPDIARVLQNAHIIPEAATDAEIAMADRMLQIHGSIHKAADHLRIWLKGRGS